MAKNKLIISVALVLILAVLAFMTWDFFFNNKESSENVYEYDLKSFEKSEGKKVNYSEVNQIAPEIDKLRAVTVDAEDNIYVTGKDRLIIYNKSGELISSVKTNADALCMTISEDKKVFLGARDHIEIFDTEGNLLSKWKALNSKVVITSIALSEENVFVADAGNKIVYRYDLNGKLINKIGEKDSINGILGFIIPSPYFDLAIGREGELWAVNSGRHFIESYTEDGKIVSSWGKTSMDDEGFSGCCNPSHIAVLSDGAFVTSEKGLVRIKIHEPSGEFREFAALPEQFEKGTKGLDLAVDSENRIIVADPQKGLVRIFEKK